MFRYRRFSIRRLSQLSLALLLVGGFFIILLLLHLLIRHQGILNAIPSPPLPRHHGHYHPIDDLIREAHRTFDGLMSKQSHSLAEAAASYRDRRDRHPPPAFKLWYEFAAERNAVIVEDFFDQIYHDLEPFWAVDPAKIRKDADDYEMRINVRNGRATTKSGWFWTKIWLDMVRTIEHILPDMDIALNAMDEPRIVVPWEEMRALDKRARKTRVLVSPEKAVTGFQNLPPPRSTDSPPRQFDTSTSYWDLIRRGCSPTSLARQTKPWASFHSTPTISADNAGPHMNRGFVSNYTLSTEVCHQPDLQGLEGIFIEPLSVSTTAELFPLFGGSKLAVNNEILLPAAMYWEGDVRFTGGNDANRPWAAKLDALIWRGVATGGRNRADNWKGFHRHRFVAMNNASMVEAAERGTQPPNFQLHVPANDSHLFAQKIGRLGEWVDSWSDVGFVDLSCFPIMEGGQCNYTGRYFEKADMVAMGDQFQYKYLVDIDGNSFSGRYLGFLRSTSLPIKATLYREWHDSRLVAWKHFVPMDNRFIDYYAIMQYFLGAGPDVPGHDEEAEMIAMEGKAWASQVLRREDMQIYMLRLLLEYARVSNERREKMGWVEDLLSGNETMTEALHV